MVCDAGCLLLVAEHVVGPLCVRLHSRCERRGGRLVCVVLAWGVRPGTDLVSPVMNACCSRAEPAAADRAACVGLATTALWFLS